MRQATEVIVRRSIPGLVELMLEGPPLNILDSTAQRQLTAVLWQLHQEDGLDAVFVSGAGHQAFSVGADIRDEQTGAGGDPWGGSTLDGHWTTLLASLPALTVALVEGVCLGGGLELALCADLRIASPESSFGMPEVRIGLIPGMGGTVRLPTLVGPAWATRMLMTGAPISAHTAAEIGLVQALHPAPRTLALTWLEDLRSAAPLARSAVKSLIANPGGFEAEAASWRSLAATDDAIEGRSAFLDHRPPHFSGRPCPDAGAGRR